MNLKKNNKVESKIISHRDSVSDSYELVDKDIKEEEKELFKTLEDKLKTELKSYKGSQNYKEFIRNIRTESDIKVPGYYILINDKNTIIIFRSYLNAPVLKLVDVYKPENNVILENLKKVLLIDDKNNYRTTDANEENGYSPICNYLILNILLAKWNVESKNEQVFTEFKIPKKSGGMRDIIAPHEEIRAALRYLNNKLQILYDKKNIDFQIAYKKGKCVKDGAKIHQNHQYVYNIDLKDFYPSCKRELVEKYLDIFFKASFNRQMIVEEFYNIILKDNGLFIGNPISGTIVNAVISGPVSYIKNICNKFGMEFSVYADDMSFSSDKKINKNFVIQIFKDAFAEHNLLDYFTINEKKCEGFSKNKRKVTGVSINDSNKITVNERYYKNIRAGLHNLKYGKEVPLDVLKGKIAYMEMLDETSKLDKLIEKYKDEIIKYNLVSKKTLAKIKEA